MPNINTNADARTNAEHSSDASVGIRTGDVGSGAGAPTTVAIRDRATGEVVNPAAGKSSMASQADAFAPNDQPAQQQAPSQAPVQELPYWGANDSLILDAARHVINSNRASGASLAKSLGIGYARAGRLLDALSDKGVVGPKNGTRPRQVLMDMSQLDELVQQHAGNLGSPDNQVTNATQQPVASESVPNAQRVSNLSADDVSEVADSDSALEMQPPSASENLGFVDTDTGELVNTTPGRAAGAASSVSQPQASQGQDRVPPSSAPQPGTRATDYRESRNQQGSGGDGGSVPPSDNGGGQPWFGYDEDESPIDWNDATWDMFQDVSHVADDEEAQLAELRRMAGGRHSDEMRTARQRISPRNNKNSNFDAYGHDNYVQFDFRADESESKLRRKLSMAMMMIYQRFVNPSLVRIESEWVETRTHVEDGRTKTYARLRYSDRVEGALNAVKDLFGCSMYNVMQLIQLRAGLGVSSRGTIGNVDPNDFKLTDDQVVELCRDIIESQNLNGNPLGPVQGIPGGNHVRDDTGRFVVVAKTRCFPLGYMPTQLIHDLRDNPSSPLHDVSASEISQAIGEQWINQTYPQLCANTSGNLMYQARAIENMMRGLMIADGRNPADRDIPEIVERKTLMELRAEEASIGDPALREANEIKHNNIEKAMSRFFHRFNKERGTRKWNGQIRSESDRRRNGVGDTFRVLSSLERAAKAAHLMIMISAIPEAAIANREQALGIVLSNVLFDSMHKDVAARYQVTDQLERMSQDPAAVEALDVYQTLYRIGGHDAIEAFDNEGMTLSNEAAAAGVPGSADGRVRNQPTRADLQRFLREWGVIGDNPTVSDRVRQLFNIQPGQEAGFLSNVSHWLDNMMLGDSLFKRSEARQFVQMGMAEMARASLHGRESYTNSQVLDWGMGSDGAGEMIRSLMQTDAGREAFMTLGITSLGRKSPVEHQLRLILAKNGVSEFLVRTMFDRFPEYGVNKILQMFPLSNTFSFIVSRGISKAGDVLSIDALSRVRNYQAGGRVSLAEGFRKNLMYDTIMAGEKLAIAGIYAGTVLALGGVQPPDDPRDRYTWSEWKIGDGDDAVPIRWAWWMDDISGVGFPLGLCWAICEQGGWSPESRQVATKVFINAVANFNSGTAVFDVIDLVNNFDTEAARALDPDFYDYEVSRDEWLMTALEQGFWDLIGDLTPSIIGELVPWSKDFLFKRPDADAHTASRVYDTGEGSKYSMDEAQEGYHTRQTDSYSDYVRRRATQTNILYAMFADRWLGGDDVTGYKYDEQPIDTMVDPYAQAMWDRFYLDLDPSTSDLPFNDQEDLEAELYSRAETVCQWITDNYDNPIQANLDGFVLNYDARVNCRNYCYHMVDEAWERFHDATDNVYLDPEEYQRVVDERVETIAYYRNILYNYILSDEIPWSLPRYARQESDREVRYVDDQGNPMTWLDTIGRDAPAHAESYWYGNVPSILPFTSPRTAGKGHNYETIPYWVVLDEDGNPVNDLGVMYDNAANLVGGIGRNQYRNIQELMWGGQGTNMGVQVDEDGNPVLDEDGNPIPTPVDETLSIERGGIPTLGGRGGNAGGRPWRQMTEVFPESIRNLSSDATSDLLGIPSSIPTDDSSFGSDNTGRDREIDSDGTISPRRSSYSGGGARTYSRSSYYTGGYQSSYNPHIYSSNRQVYGSRASGISVRQPYNANNTYLRPTYSTKGSREAYRRSDI